MENFTWFLIQCRRYFDGDLDRFLVLAVIGDGTFPSRNAPENFTVHDLGRLTMADLNPVPINLQSIADFSVIPRETVPENCRI